MDENIVLLGPLNHRAPRVLGLFSQRNVIKSSDIANLLGISVRQTRELLMSWVAQGWLEISDPSRRGRKYRLADTYQKLVEQRLPYWLFRDILMVAAFVVPEKTGEAFHISRVYGNSSKIIKFFTSIIHMISLIS